MFDQSNGKGRIFFHPAVEQEFFGLIQSCNLEVRRSASAEEAERSISSHWAYKQMVEQAFSSFQSLRSCRQNDVLGQRGPSASDTLFSPLKPRIPEASRKVDRMINARDVSVPFVALEGLVRAEKTKVTPLFVAGKDHVQDIIPGDPCDSSGSQISGRKHSEVAASQSMQENTEDLNALLSSEDDDDDDDIRSTGHSPDESLGKGHNCEEGEEDEVQKYCYKRRTPDECNVVFNTNVACFEEYKKERFVSEWDGGHADNDRRKRIKRTVKALRKIIPGGNMLDMNFVLDKTIKYVKNLHDRMKQMETTHYQSHTQDSCP
ncbi:hypothetical protein KP509_21G028000 [Ceratopteris richardii]|nr:hypothetical protein KP509_21G028000 [Ceratopteris richardii]